MGICGIGVPGMGLEDLHKGVECLGWVSGVGVLGDKLVAREPP